MRVTAAAQTGALAFPPVCPFGRPCVCAFLAPTDCLISYPPASPKLRCIAALLPCSSDLPYPSNILLSILTLVSLSILAAWPARSPLFALFLPGPPSCASMRPLRPLSTVHCLLRPLLVPTALSHSRLTLLIDGLLPQSGFTAIHSHCFHGSLACPPGTSNNVVGQSACAPCGESRITFCSASGCSVGRRTHPPSACRTLAAV